MLVLVACERSGRVRDAFLAAGHDAVSCDLEPSDVLGPHIQDDVLDILLLPGWDLLIAHPPCTYLANSGVRWLLRERKYAPERWDAMHLGAAFFLACLYAPIPRVAVENPIMSRPAMEIIKQKPTQIIQPWQFGWQETKATCLWLRNLPPLKPTQIVEDRFAIVHKEPPSPNRQRWRSETCKGIAEAMAAQWGGIT